MDSLANYGSDGDNSNNSDDAKMPCSRSSASLERRASDANYDSVQMDMSEGSNNNNSSGDSESERAQSPARDRHSAGSRRDSSRQRSSPADQRRSDHESHSSNSRDDRRRDERKNERSRRRRSRERSKSRRGSNDDRRTRERTNHSRDSRDRKRSRIEVRKSSRDDERRRDRKSSSSCRDEHRSEDRDRDRHNRDDRRDRSGRDYRRDRERRESREEKTKDRHRDERTSRENNKEKERSRTRSKSKERVAPPPLPPQPLPFRTLSYREEKGRSKLAQLEKLGIELKPPVPEPIIPAIIGEPNYYNPLATATQGKYAEQIQKRKLLWAKSKQQEEGKASVAAASTANTWMGTTFTHDQDGKVTAKFKRLMGIKGDAPPAPQPANKPDILKKQEEMFNNMEQQYEVARATTHTQRGVGLGYATGGYQFPR